MEINPSLHSMYTYDYKDQGDCVEVHIHAVPGIKYEDILLSVNQENSTILCKVENEVPFLAGTLFSSIKEYHSSMDENVYTISLTKADNNQKWEVVIKDFDSDGNIDPHSAYLLVIKFGSQDFLAEAIKMKYCNAIAHLAKQINPDDGFWDVAEAAYKKYDSDEIALALGYKNLRMGNTNDAFKYLEISSNKGNIEASSALAEFLSPYVEPAIKELVDPNRALKILLKLHEENKEDPYVCFNLSPFYEKGVYIEKDEKKAEELYKYAISIKPELSEVKYLDGGIANNEKELSPVEIEGGETEGLVGKVKNQKNKIIISLGFLTIAGIGIYGIIRLCKKKN